MKSSIIIGAGPAGLAVAACLKVNGISATVLERSHRVASSWHEFYEPLRLHTDKSNSALPYLPLPGRFPTYPARDEMISYFESYAERFDLDLRFGQAVKRMWRRGSAWMVETSSEQMCCQTLIIATGTNQVPNLPSWSLSHGFHGELLHSSAYRSGTAYRGKRVLVVGFGNSGHDIVADLVGHGAVVSLSVRGSVALAPRDIFGIPIVQFARLLNKLPTSLADALSRPFIRLLLGDVASIGFSLVPEGPFTHVQRHGRIPVLDSGTLKLLKSREVPAYPGVETLTESLVTFEDGRRAEFDAIILATGYRPALEFLEQGVAHPGMNGAEGLFFCGFKVVATGVLREISLEARAIAEQIGSRQGG